MQGERDNQGSGLLAMLLGVTLAVSIFGNSGCTNVGSATSKVEKASAHVEAMPTLRLPPTLANSIVGTWICADSHCEPGTLKVIGPQLNKIQTEFTEYPTEDSQSICRFREVSPLALDEEISGPFTNKITGHVTRQAYELVDDPGNTHDCADRLTKHNSDIPTDTENLIFEDDAPDELVLNGITYRRLADDQVRAAEKDDSRLRNATLAGDWDCIEPGSEDLKQKISGDQKSMVTDSVVTFDESQKCHIQQTAILQISDVSNPQKIFASRTKGLYSLVSDPANTQNCAEIVTLLNTEKLKEAPSVEQLTIERDGTNELLIQDKRFARRRESL